MDREQDDLYGGFKGETRKVLITMKPREANKLVKDLFEKYWKISKSGVPIYTLIGAEENLEEALAVLPKKGGIEGVPIWYAVIGEKVWVLRGGIDIDDFCKQIVNGEIEPDAIMNAEELFTNIMEYRDFGLYTLELPPLPEGRNPIDFYYKEWGPQTLNNDVIKIRWDDKTLHLTQTNLEVAVELLSVDKYPKLWVEDTEVLVMEALRYASQMYKELKHI